MILLYFLILTIDMIFKDFAKDFLIYCWNFWLDYLKYDETWFIIDLNLFDGIDFDMIWYDLTNEFWDIGKLISGLLAFDINCPFLWTSEMI